MKEAMGGTWIFILVITFLALFTTFVSVTTNYSRCYKIKDEIISTIERYKGVNEKSLSTINTYLAGLGYRSTGQCPNDSACWLPFSINKNEGSVGYGGDNANYCISKYNVVTTYTNDKGQSFSTAALGHPSAAYYQVIVFFRIDWPILHTFFRLKVDGDTSVIYLNQDVTDFDSCVNGVDLS